MDSRNGSNRDFTPTKVVNFMKKCDFERRKTKKCTCFFVVHVMKDGLEKKLKEIANQLLNPELPL